MFLEIFKKVNAKKFLKKHFLFQRVVRVEEIDKITSVACIVDMDAFTNVNALYAIVEDIKLTAHQFNLIVFTEVPKKHPEIAYPLFSLKDFDWRLRAKRGEAKTFLTREYDVLINYFTEEKLPMLLLSASTKAKLRVGFQELDQNYNDILFKVPIHHHKLFRKEFLKYLNILNKL